MTQPTLEIPGYNIIRSLGHGGMARVYLAEQKSVSREVALKVMMPPPGNVNLWAKRFIHEAKVIAQLSHPNIVPVYDVGTHQGQFYISMEYLAGGDLDRYKKNGLSLNHKLKIIVGVAAGLDFAGEKGFVHRDIKPDNVMFRENGSPVILDFGIVKQLDGNDDMTQTGTVVGTAKYMSPEQAQGIELDARSDIYSLGVMFYELLTGNPPFQGESAVATLLMHVSETPPPLPSSLSPLQVVIDKCLAKDPSDRYPRARGLIEHLQALEPELKQIISQQQNTLSTSSNDATVIMASDVSDEATIHSSNPTQEIDESELTKVLSSAKATIKDFSAEARNRRARRARRATTAIASCALISVCYLGYHQFYLVPQERAKAEQKVRQAQQQSKNKIASLLVEAENIGYGTALSNFDQANKYITLNREVLKLDPENTIANNSLNRLGEAYIEFANLALLKENHTYAEKYHDYAQKLVPANNTLLALQEKLKVFRGAKIDSQLQSEKINTLLDLAQADIKNNGGFSESAYAKLLQVQRIEPDNPKALEAIDTMLASLYRTTDEQIKKQQLVLADNNLSALAKYYPDGEKVSALQNLYQVQKRRASSQQTRKSLSKKASRLVRERRTLSTNDELREVYLAMLQHDRKNKEATEGLEDTSRFDADQAIAAIGERDFLRAQEQIDIVEKFTPKYAPLPQLKERLKNARNAALEADGLLSEADQLIDKKGSAKVQKENLVKAYENIDKARNIDRSNPKIPEVLTRLENVYVNTISKALADGNEKMISGFFRDTSEKAWPSERLLNMHITQRKAEEEKAQKKRKRIVGGGF